MSVPIGNVDLNVQVATKKTANAKRIASGEILGLNFT
jgi:hypothetical protein